MRKHDEKHILWRFEMVWAFLYQMDIPLCLVRRLAGGAACFACIVITAVPPLASGSLQAVQQPLSTSSGVWLVYLSHVLTCICLQHVVGVCLWCHCCSSPLGIGFPSGCSTAPWYKLRCVACLFVTCADVHLPAACSRCLPVVSLLQFPPWHQVPFRLFNSPLVQAQVCGLFICHMY